MLLDVNAMAARDYVAQSSKGGRVSLNRNNLCYSKISYTRSLGHFEGYLPYPSRKASYPSHPTPEGRHDAIAPDELNSY